MNGIDIHRLLTNAGLKDPHFDEYDDEKRLKKQLKKYKWKTLIGWVGKLFKAT